jgi:hypothetical protein
MKAIEILKKNPKSANLVVDWFFSKMLESLKGDSVDEEFRNFMREQALDNTKMAAMIDANPRMLFDVFDENEVFIQINVFDKFSYSINQGEAISGSWTTRKETEAHAMSTAFEILENKLTPKELNDENQ